MVYSTAVPTTESGEKIGNLCRNKITMHSGADHIKVTINDTAKGVNML